MSKNTTEDMFMTAKEKSANDFQLGKDMIDAVDATLGVSVSRIRRINEHRHLASGTWPEMDQWLGKDPVAFQQQDSEGEPLDLNDFVIHRPKLNNVTNFIIGGFLAQPLISVIRDFSTYGRKYREEQRTEKAKAHYYQTFIAPQEELIRTTYFQEKGVSDPLALTPDEQRQAQSDLQARYKSQIPQSLLDDMKRIKTPDEKIRQALLDYDMRAYNIEEKFFHGAESAVIDDEEYYMIGKRGIKPTLKALTTKWVRWAGSETCDYSEDGQMASYDEYQTPHDFVTEFGREVIKKPNFMKDIEQYFSEIPGYYTDKNDHKHGNTKTIFDAEMDFLDMVGENPGIIKNNWRTFAGQQEIAGLYGSLSSHHMTGRGIRKLYTVFRWTETITYVQREEFGKIEEYFFSADYKRNKAKDIMVRKFPISRVYHGWKIANRFYVGIEPVSWQFFGGIFDFEPKLTICGRRYWRSNGNEENKSLMEPAIPYQLSYNITYGKREDLIRKDVGKITFWNMLMRPSKFSDEDYMSLMMKFGNVPYDDSQVAQKGDTKPAFVIDQSSTAKLQEYGNTLAELENEMYKQCRVNRDALGQANPYQSNAQTQSNIEGASKQLLPLYTMRRMVKERVLNYFSNLSMLCLLEDHEKQALLLDDFSRMHLQVNAEDIKAHATSIFVVDDYEESEKTKRIQAQILTMLQAGTSTADVIDIMSSDSIPEMREIAQVSEMKTKEANDDAHQKRMAELQEQNKGLVAAEKLRQDKKEAIEERKNQVNLMLADIEASTMERAADIDENKEPDSVTRTKLDIQSKEKIAREKNQTDLLRENIKAKTKATTKV